MAKYKNLILIEGFLEKMFGKIVTKAGQEVVKDMKKRDPKVGNKMVRLTDLIKDIEKDMKGMSKIEKQKYKDDIWKKAGVV